MRTLIKFRHLRRKISRKAGCIRDSESTFIYKSILSLLPFIGFVADASHTKSAKSNCRCVILRNFPFKKFLPRTVTQISQLPCPLPFSGKNPALQDSPPASGRFSDIIPLRRSAILPGGLFYFTGKFNEVSCKVKTRIPASLL